MTSAQAFPELVGELFFFSLVASAFAFNSMLLIAGLHP
jgi:hypothetical protein